MLRTKVLLAQGFRILSSRPWPELPLPRRSGEELNGPQGQRPGFGPGPVTSDGRTNRNASSARRAACCRLDRKPGWTVTRSAVPIQSLWDQGSLCPDLPIVQEKSKIASPTHLFFLVKFFSFSNYCVAQTKLSCGCRGDSKLPVSNFHSAELAEVGGPTLLALTTG